MDTVENVLAAVNHIFYVNFVFIQATNFSLITVTSLKFLHSNGCCNQEVALLIFEILMVCHFKRYAILGQFPLL
jgi:hypothetical protein